MNTTECPVRRSLLPGDHGTQYPAGGCHPRQIFTAFGPDGALPTIADAMDWHIGDLVEAGSPTRSGAPIPPVSASVVVDLVGDTPMWRSPSIRSTTWATSSEALAYDGNRSHAGHGDPPCATPRASCGGRAWANKEPERSASPAPCRPRIAILRERSASASDLAPQSTLLIVSGSVSMIASG